MSVPSIGSHSTSDLAIAIGVAYHLGIYAEVLVPAMRMVGGPERIALRALAASSDAPRSA
jgi:hypothetical protein